MMNRPCLFSLIFLLHWMQCRLQSLLDFDVSSIKYENIHLPELFSPASLFPVKTVRTTLQAERQEQILMDHVPELSWFGIRTRNRHRGKSPMIQFIPFFILDWLSQTALPLHFQLLRNIFIVKLYIWLNVEIDSSDELRMRCFFFDFFFFLVLIICF